MNLATIGFAAKTAALEKADAVLKTLKSTAQKTEDAVSKFNRAAGGAMGATKMAAAAQGAASATTRLGAAAQGAVNSATRLGSAARNAATGTNAVGAAASGSIGPVEALRNRWQVLLDSLQRTPAAAAGAQTSLNRLGAAANDNINRLQSTPGNIAAQFQDIGVTAAGGMSPMLIALQQGTQLSSAMAGGLGNVVRGFTQLFSVTSILTIGLVGLAAAGLQNVDWMALASTLLNGLADLLSSNADLIAEFGTILLFAFSPVILAAIINITTAVGVGLVKAIWSATGAMIAFALANPFNFIVVAIGLTITALYGLHKAFGGVFTDIINWIKTTANTFIGLFVAAYRTVARVWEQLPQVLDGAFNKAKQQANELFKLRNTETGEVTTLLNFSVDKTNFNAVDRTMAIFSEERGRVQGQDFIGGFADGIRSGANALRGFASGLGPDAEALKKTAAPRTGMSEAEKIAKDYDALIKSTERRITALQTETTALGMSERAGMLYRNQQELIAQALEKNIPLTDTVRAKLDDLAQSLTSAEIEKSVAEATRAFEEQQRVLRDQADLIGLTGLELEYTKARQELVNQAVKDGKIDLANMNDEMRAYLALLGDRAMIQARAVTSNDAGAFIAGVNKSFADDMNALRSQRGEIGLTGKALQVYRYEQELLLSAMEKGIQLNPQNIALMKQQAAEYVNLSDDIAKTRERVEFFRDTHRSFFAEMIGGLRQGQSVWEAFGNAVMSVVNRIIDRLLSMDGGILDKLVNLGGSVLGLTGKSGLGNQSSFNNWMKGGQYDFDGLLKNARGNTFGVERFAQGGTFTNGIYNKPTLFKFAGGGMLGEMGEAGPEAVMPLKRGPNGSLGVEIHRSQPVRVVVTVDDDRFNAYTDQRAGALDARNAPAVASAGAQVAAAENRFNSSRRL